MKTNIKGRLLQLYKNTDQETLGLMAFCVIYILYAFETYERSSFITTRYALPSLIFLIVGVVGAGITAVSRRVLQHPMTWAIFSLFSLLCILLSWPFTSNHGFLVFYLSLAVWVSLSQNKSPWQTVLSNNARLLIGFAMLFAVIQKATTPEFISGGFFYYSAVYDSRFSSLAELLNLSITNTSYSEYLGSLIMIQGQEHPAIITLLDEIPGLKMLSQLQAWFILAVEFAVAFLFLLPIKYRLSQWWDYVLLIFVLGTYIVSIEYVFGFVFLITAFIQSDCKRSRRLKIAYATIFTLTIIGMLIRVWHYS